MQYCDLGSLEKAIKQGEFQHPETGEPRVVRSLAAFACIGPWPTTCNPCSLLVGLCAAAGFEGVAATLTFVACFGETLLRLC